MIVDRLQYETIGSDMLRLCAEARAESAAGVTLDPWIELSKEVGEIETVGDPFVAGLLVPCMHQGEDLHVKAPVSAALLKGIEEVQLILSAWYSNLTPIRVTADSIVEVVPAPREHHAGCFFSGGVDAWYTLAKHKDEISHLILVRGFDIGAEAKGAIWDQTVANVQDIATSLSKRLILARTNIRAVCDMRRGRAGWGKPFDGDFWGQCLHGAALAAISMCMQNPSGGLRKLFIGATYSYDHLAPWGSHPLLDHWWSTQAVQLVHDGAEANRMQKIKRIADVPQALSSLRVCYENREGQYNCCDCEKCFRTMMALRACGALEKSSAFHRRLDLREARKRLYDPHVYPWYRVILPEAERLGDKELADTLRIIIGDKFSVEQAFAKAKDRLGTLLPRRAISALQALASRKRWRTRLQNLTASVRTSP